MKIEIKKGAWAQLRGAMFEFIKAFGLTFWPLLACSVLGSAVCLERIVFFYKQRKSKERLYEELAAIVREHSSHSKALRDEALGIRLSELESSYYSGLNLLRLVASISPLLGLLGTILGVIKAFQSIASSTGPVAPHTIAAGLWEAMLTTSLGIIISLPCISMAYVFRSWGARYLNDFCSRLNKLSLALELEKVS